MVQLGDGYNFIEAVFTKEAVNSFRKNYSHLCLSQMRDRLLKVTKWQLVVKHRPSNQHFNSYMNLGVYLIVSEFVPQPGYSVYPKQSKECKHLH